MPSIRINCKTLSNYVCKMNNTGTRRNYESTPLKLGEDGSILIMNKNEKGVRGKCDVQLYKNSTRKLILPVKYTIAIKKNRKPTKLFTRYITNICLMSFLT